MIMAPKKPPLSVVGSTPAGVQPARKLGVHGMASWRAIQAEYRIDDCGGVELLTQICAATDRLEAMSAQINRDGEMIRTKTGMRAHPLIREETALRAFITRAIEKLGIGVEAIKEPGRPPGYAGSHGGWTA
jgi:hypothetical protein